MLQLINGKCENYKCSLMLKINTLLIHVFYETRIIFILFDDMK